MIRNLLYLLFIFLIFIQNTAAQQTYKKSFKINWLPSKKVILNKSNSITIPTVINQTINQNMLPVFVKTLPDNNGLAIANFKLNNIVLSRVNGSISLNVIKNIKDKPFYKFSVTKTRGKMQFQLYLEPLVKKGNTIYKIDSFTLNYTTTPSINNKNTIITNSNSVLAQGNWYKFSVDTTGIFKIDVKFLKSLGINTKNLDANNIRIFGNGGAMLPQLNSDFRYDGLQENAIFVNDGNDGIFNNNDFLLFYAKGPNSWKINPANGSVSHIKNIYSDFAYYFITIDNGTGKRIKPAIKITAPSTLNINTFNDYFFYEKDETNLFAIGQQWFGESFSIENEHQFNFKFNNIDTSKPLSIKIRAVASSNVATSLDATLNNNLLYALNFPANSPASLTLATAKLQSKQVNISDENLSFNLTYNNNGNPSARAYLDYIEVSGYKHLIANKKQFGFRSFEAANATTSTVVSYQIGNANNIFQVWDVTDFLNPQIIENISNSNDFIFKAVGGKLREYQVLNSDDYYKPKTLKTSKIVNQNLHALKDIDYLVITNNELMNQALRLADYHKKVDNFTTAVVDVQQIYNEFGSGSPDVTAIRDFIHHLYTTASSPDKKIKFVTLFGDTSYDYKDRISNNNNIVPAFESLESFNLATSYVTDDYFGMMDDNEGTLGYSDKQDVATGRYPVTTVQEAKSAVDKTLSYTSKTAFGDWRNKVTVVADDPDKASEFILEETVDRISVGISKNKPVFNIIKIYADAYKQQTSAGGARYPDVNKAITAAVENGTLVIDYYGHGGEDGWANERILEVPQIQNWHNSNTLPLFITVTCEFAKLDNPQRPTAGEFVFNNVNGGATSMITTTREIFVSVGQAFNETLVPILFGYDGENYTISQALMNMKNLFTSPQRLFVYYFGDPALKLAQPKGNIKITEMNGIAITQTVVDTLKSLSHVSFKGIITDKNNNILTDFNGILSTTIFDKVSKKTTLDNDHFGRKLIFDAIESKIYRGQDSVKNGRFKFEFIVPKDIRIAFGKGKLSFYAQNGVIDKSGYNLDITVGGINKNAAEDKQGPSIALFMNDESFLDGGTTNQSPIFIATLKDTSGINTSTTAVDHDLIAILDDDQTNPIILNDFYQTDLDNFRKGKVKFQLRNLKPGTHSIKFRAWDTYNNPSEATLTFNVVSDSGITLSHVLNYPNPFVNYTEFWFEHNRPNEPLNVQIQIFTISGKLVKTINKTVQTTGSLSRDITWNGLDDFGSKIGKGVYIYKLKVVSSITQDHAEKIEKLVILR